MVATNTVGSSNLGVGKIIDYHRNDSLNKLLRITGYVLRFKVNILPKWKKNLNEIKLDNLKVADIKESKKVWLLYEQTFIINKDNFLKVKNLLHLFSDQDNLLHVKTRNSDIKTFSHNKSILYY